MASGYFLFIIALVVLANYGFLQGYGPGITPAYQIDKVLHFVLMGTAALMANLLWRGRCTRLGPLRLYWGSVVVAILVTAEEVSQQWVPVRSFSLWDLLANLAGIAVIGQLAGLWAGKSPANRGDGDD